MENVTKGVGIDFSFFVKCIEEFQNNPKAIIGTIKRLKKEFFDNQEIFEFIRHQMIVFNRAPTVEEIRDKFGIDLSGIKSDKYNIEYYVAKIKERYLKRAFVTLITSAKEKDISALNVDDLYRPIKKLAEEYSETIESADASARPIAEIKDETIGMINAAIDPNSRPLLPAPWPTFQNKTGGIGQAEFVVIAGRPGTGKTWMLYKWAYYLASLGKKVLLFNTEMSAAATLLRLGCLLTGLRVNSVRNKTILAHEAELLKKKIDEISKLENFIITDIGFTPTLSSITKEIKIHKPEIVFIDSAYLIRADGRYNSRTENASEVSDSLKVIAEAYGIPIVIVTQHNREAVRGRPSLATLALTDSTAWNASFVLSIDPPVEAANSPEVETWKINIIKNREGDLGQFYVSKIDYEETEGEIISAFGLRVNLCQPPSQTY